MITAVDTSVLSDVFRADPKFGPAAQEVLRDCLRDGSVVACEVVWAEISAGFSTGTDATDAMRALGIGFSPSDPGAAIQAGDALRGYRQRGGTRARIVADFLIGAHARTHADRLLTRDRGFYRAYFLDLKILDPSS